MAETPPKVAAVVAHDPGGAEIVASLVATLPDLPLFALAGPARAVFERRFGALEILTLPELFSKLEPGSFLVTGTSLTSELERDALALAKTHRVRSASILDHWVNYPLRFGGPDEWLSRLPDEVWVGDEQAYRIAQEEGFPTEKLRVVRNLHLAEVQADIDRRRALHPSRDPNAIGRILLLSEPISLLSEKRFGRPDGFGFTELTLARSIAETFVAVRDRRFEQLKIRPHPKEPRSEYENIIANINSDRVVLSDTADYIEEILWADVVIAMESMGLVFALMAGRRAVSFIPSGSYSCHLPHGTIARTGDPASLLKVLGYV